MIEIGKKMRYKVYNKDGSVLDVGHPAFLWDMRTNFILTMQTDRKLNYNVHNNRSNLPQVTGKPQ